MMNIQEYCEKAENTRSDLKNIGLDNIHMILGMVTEVAELADAVKKHLAYDKDIDWVNVQEELGDLMWYVAGFCNINGLNLENILEQNLQKLSTRYPDKYNNNDALNRNLEKEREVLEKTAKFKSIGGMTLE